MKRFSLLLVSIILLSALQAKATIIQLPHTSSPDTSIVTIITTSNDTLVGQIKSEKRDAYIFLINNKKHRIHKRKIEKLIYANGKEKLVANNYIVWKKHRVEKSIKRLFRVTMVILSLALLAVILYSIGNKIGGHNAQLSNDFQTAGMIAFTSSTFTSLITTPFSLVHAFQAFRYKVQKAKAIFISIIPLVIISLFVLAIIAIIIALSAFTLVI